MRMFLAINCVVMGLTAGVFGQDGKPAALRVTSQAFAEGEKIPSKYTCDGKDVSPPLHWDGVPAGAKSIALICEDPDAPGGTWIHWVLYDLPATTSALREGVKKSAMLADKSMQGLNDFEKTGYNGPCPPAGGAHRYFFRVYALDAGVLLPSRAKKADLVKAMEGHIVAEGSLMGTYQRQ